MTEPSEDLQQIEEALTSFGVGAEESLGVRMMRRSLERIRTRTITETYGELELALARHGSLGNGAELPLVAGVLASLQESVASIAQLLAGKPTARGLIPGAIRQSVELSIGATAPGSLRLQLVPSAPSKQQPLFDDGDESLLELSVERLLALLEKARGDRDELLQDIADLGPRVTTHVETLSRWLSDGEASATLEWRSPHLTRSASIDTRGAAGLGSTLQEVSEETRALILTGRLAGGSLIRRTFELELEPPESTVIAGRVAEEALEDLEELFGQEVTAGVDVRQATLPSGETKETHLLTALSAGPRRSYPPMAPIAEMPSGT